MSIPPVLRTLLTAPGPSGYEATAAAAFRDAARAFTDDVRGDVIGSSTARIPGTASGRTLAVVGHIDEIGLIVTHIEDTGFLRFVGVGGWDPQVLVGQRVELATKAGVVPGVIGKKPIHLIKPDERSKAPEIKNLHIDIGAADGDGARELVRIGDVAVVSGEPVELPNGRAVSRSMDNRLGCYVVYEVARLVAEEGGAPGDVVAVAAVQEETGLSGALTTAHSLRPDVAIAVDVTHATDAPDIPEQELGKHHFGSGPVIERGTTMYRSQRAADRGGRSGGDPLHPVGLDAHLDRCGRHPFLAWRRGDRARLDPAALHALAGRDGAARRRREHREADRGVCASAAR